ncbi:MAG: choice-of-anchor D domain-containing protein, partial [Deltaproteobacteria bacterium]
MKLDRRLALLSTLTTALACSGEDPPGLTCPAGTVAVDGQCVAEGTDGGQDPRDAGMGPRDGGNDPVDGGMGAASISTAQLSFGRVVMGDEVSENVVFTNNTPDALIVSIGAVVGTSEIVITSTVPVDGVMLDRGASFTLTFTYAPQTVGAQQATVDIDLCTGDCPGTITLSGEGIREAIVCQPSTLDFGLVNPGDCLTIAEDCLNDSSYDASIDAIMLSGSSSPAYTVTGTSAVPVTLASGQTQSFDVTYCPTDFVQDSGVLILEVSHPDPAQRSKRIGLVGVGGGPDIECVGTADFGIIGTGQTAGRNVTCTNTGVDPLTISAADFAAGTTREITATLTVAGSTTGSTLPIVLEQNGTVDIAMTYRPLAPGAHTTTFDIASDDRDTPTVTIDVTAEAIDSTGCAIEVVPATIEFGGVAPGTPSEASANITNIGTGVCAATVVGLAAGSDAQFEIVGNAPSGILNAGESLTVTARFLPTAEAAYTGAIDVQTSDPNNAAPTIGLAGTGLSPFGSVQASPTSIDFGTVAVGCSNQATRTFTLTNFTGGAATVDVSVEAGSSADFAVVTTPASFMIPDGGASTVTIGFVPSAMQTSLGRIRVDVMGLPPLFVPVRGTGGAMPTNTETFPGQQPGVRDILFLIDDSCSMAAEQARLADVAPIFIDRGDVSGADYHMAVATTDPTPAVRGTLRGNPSVIDWMSASRVEDLVANIQQGTGGSGNEQGLRGAAEAVSNPTLIAGANAGFLRNNATLTVILISDEEDSSPNTVASYLSDMATRPVGLPGSLRVFTITGGNNGCQGGGTSAQATQRYPLAASQSGGFDASICSPQYNEVITQIADETFGLVRDTFQLGSNPAPGTVMVRVNGAVVPTDTGTVANWGVDYTTGQVVFAPGRAPATTATVEIDYTGVCVPSTCGDGTPDAAEECDDGNATNTDACIDTCYAASCGDGFVQAGVEFCDDGNTIVGDGCNFICGIEECGNGILEPPETCDLGTGNSDTAPDTCRTTCAAPSCGDAVVDTGEPCDDGNGSNTDACLVGCVAATCGDGFVQQGVEDCDDQNNDPNDLCDQCQYTFGTFTITSTPGIALVPQQGGTPLQFAPNLDDGLANVTIGFPFEYLGVPVTEVAVGTNGFLTFEISGTAAGNDPIPDTDTPNALIAWWWDDLDLRLPLTPAAVTETSLIGTAPNRVRVFTFLNVPRYRGNFANPARGVLLNAEVRFYEGTNVIEVHYGQLGLSGTLNNFGATVGYEVQGGVFGEDPLGCSPNCNRQQWPDDTLFTYT